MSFFFGPSREKVKVDSSAVSVDLVRQLFKNVQKTILKRVKYFIAEMEFATA